MKKLSKKARCKTHGQESSYFLGWEEYEKNPYDNVENPSGMIQMGVAENQVSLDLVESWVRANPDAAAFVNNCGQSVFRELALFQDYYGLPALKKALADLMSQIRGNKVAFDPNNLVLTAGATSANEALIFCLANPGDAFLLPTPYYPGFDRDLRWRTGVEIVPVECTSANGFRITESALEDAYKQAQKQNLKVKGVLVTNPSNPLGTTMTRKEVKLLLSFIDSKSIHLISDEIYSGTVFDSPSFVSVMELGDTNTHLRNRVHLVYSLSKDLGLPGFRVGAIYSNDDTVLSAATKMSSFGLVSSQTQYLLSALLSDNDFTTLYLGENQNRLKLRQKKLVSGLNKIGISCLDGLFCWVDMRHLLSSNTFEAEMELWTDIVHQVRLNISPGSSCHCAEPGWFRLCFANMSQDTLQLAILRLTNFVNHSRTKSLTNWVFRLSLQDCRLPEER